MISEKIVLIGAGSAMFTRGLLFDLISRAWECELVLVDTDQKALQVAENLARKMIQAKSCNIHLSADTDRRKVLSGATVVICTIGVGGRRAWEQDVFVPRKYGIYQPVGDSVMPGGTSRALRMIHAMVDIARDVLELASDALFFNYGNPMGPVCRGVRKATGANMIGLCHGVFHVGHYLTEVLGVKELEYTAMGMNHLTWFTEVRTNGFDAMGQLQKYADEQIAKDAESKASPTELNLFTWQLFKLAKAFPAVLDRHITEFFPQMFSRLKSYYGVTLGVDAFSFEETIALGDRIFDEMRMHALSDKPLDDEYFKAIGGEHEQVIDIIQSIRQDSKRIFSANLPNRGQIPNLPIDSIVEGPAIATSSGLRAIMQKPLPTVAAGVLATRMMWVEMTVDAALEGSREKFIQALLLDGAVTSLDVAEKMADELLEVQAPYLPQFTKRK